MPSISEGLLRVRDKARKNKSLVFTELLHHATPELMLASYQTLNKRAAAGLDGQSWQAYGMDNLEEKLETLRKSLFDGTYRAMPSQRVYIPKENGTCRPLGIASIEDKIAQNAVRTILEQVYDPIFKGFSYGFRPGRNCHDALDALAYCILRKRVNWILDADLKGYFDSIPHELLIRVLEQKIGDPRILRLIKKWLRAGVMEMEGVKQSENGTIQGGIISPLLANIYLHYVLDCWVDEWRSNPELGEVYIVRYADDFIVCFQYRRAAEMFLSQLKSRLAHCQLELHNEKTRLIEFGRFAAQDRKARGDPRPETFQFLGFTHICAVAHNGGFKLARKTASKRLCKKLQEIKSKLREMMHREVEGIVAWLKRSLAGYYQYFAVPGNLHCLRTMRHLCTRYLYKILRKRSQKAYKTVNWDWINHNITPYLPEPRVVHEYPDARCRRKWKLP